VSDLIEQLIAASRDERLSTGALYREAADEMERLKMVGVADGFRLTALEQERDAALAEVELLHQADCAPSFHLLQRAEAAEAEVARLRTFFAYSEESIWKQRAEAAEAKLRDTYCPRCHERMYP
jgi:hypothetical protein